MGREMNRKKIFLSPALTQKGADNPGSSLVASLVDVHDGGQNDRVQSDHAAAGVRPRKGGPGL